MFIGHLPAGYLLTSGLIKLSGTPARAQLMMPGLVGAIAPDFDLFWCYLIDHAQRHHHLYFTHWPLLWLVTLAVFLLLGRVTRNNKIAVTGVVFCLNGIVHLVLDTVVGDVWWLMPFVNQPYALFKVSALYQPWWLNFFLHWSFMLELALTGAAVWLWWYKHRQIESTVG
ncbi:metal-dependent hydrolase [Klebsiella aerogenes]|uniref:metal-dependent hydrolase n=1 Tax=Klebsiella aerogenes TaxID=548 RepID=UPI001BD66D85|nr:metal-dependent hydrolase [Klebsiella aerogenes]